MRKDLCNTRFI